VSRAILILALLLPATALADGRTLVHAELDPLPFVNAG
jgi:hypothetical protein